MKQLISIGDLIDQSWNKYRANMPFFLQLSGWLVIIAILNTVALLLYPSAGAIAYHTSFTAAEMTGIVIYAFTNILLSPLLGFWVFVSLTLGAQSVLTGERLNVSDIMRETKKRFLPALVVAALVGLTLILAQIITLGPSLIVGAIGFLTQNGWLLGIANALMVIGLVASLILTSRWTLYYVLSPYAAILDRVKNKQALQKSRAMTEGKFWHVLIRLFFPKIVFVLFGVLVAVIVSLVVNTAVAGSVGLNLDVQQRLSDLVSAVLPIFAAIFLHPLIFLSDVLLYRNLAEQSSAGSNT